MKPCILTMGLDQTLIDEVLQGIISNPVVDLPVKTSESNENLTFHDWVIDTKYYTCDVQFCVVKQKLLVEQDIADATEVILLLLDPNNLNTLAKADSWLPFLSVIDCETKCLVCQNIDSFSEINRSDAQKWCDEHNFELLELEKKNETDEDSEEEMDDRSIKDVYGTQRIIQTLQLHSWPDMVMKG
ncbi:unnamed protein product [Didymodactylos carnosus]|uniref:Alpha-and gamma-adaptin binding protein n=2 Tax=Didymodactylos carnosus TaxID=1234261 RepID=A0A813RLQ6_9BILA|nr:unnamed protein product [Didymodactylos carnosus]CAF3566591.1 unnamed protein product [Didymodactylos carnosus]